MNEQKLRFDNCFDKKHKNGDFFLLAICGALIGIVNGFFGGGGGMICVPLLEKVFRLRPKKAHATALVVIFPISFVSALIYCLNDHIDFVRFSIVGSGVFLGGFFGAILLKRLPEKLVKIVFIALMIFGGIRMILSGVK